MSSALSMYSAFINMLFSKGGISVPTDFHERCQKISTLVDMDVSGIANTVLGYGINAASDAKYKIECEDETLQKLLNTWLEKINLEIPGVPTGLQELSKEYFKERWQGSSFCTLRMKNWEKVTVGQTNIVVPTTMWFVNGSSIYVKRPAAKNYKLGSDTYFLDEVYKDQIPKNDKEEIIIQKPYNRWHDEYPTPYLIKTGVYKNWLGMKTLQEKTDEIVTKVLPYLFLIKENDKGNEIIGDSELQGIFDNFKVQYEKYINKKGELPANVIPGTRDYTHLIPDLRNAVSEELFRQGTRAILSGLGFVDLLEITPSRQENRMNPKPFIAEINAGVSGFKSILLDAIYIIAEKNKVAHKKMFSDNNNLMIVNSPLKINVEQLIDQYRSAFVYGNITNETYHEILQIDHEQEKERMKGEWESGERELFYPHVVSNQEDKGIDTVIPTTKKQIEKQVEKEKKPIAMNEVESIDDLEIAPYTKEKHPKYLDKYPQTAIDLWIEVFNESIPKGEDYAFPAAWSVMKKYLRRHYTKNPDGTYTKKS